MGSQGYTKFRNITEIPLFSLILIYYVEVQEEENFVTAILFVEVLQPSQPNGVMFFVLRF